jgi:hypothetical protein
MVAKFVARRVESVLSFVDEKIYGETNSEPGPYRRYRR